MSIRPTNTKITDVKKAFNDIKREGHLHSVDYEPWITDMTQSHIQGFAWVHGKYMFVSHNDSVYPHGKMIVADQDGGNAWKFSIESDVGSHPGGMQIIGDVLVVPVEPGPTEGSGKSEILFYDLSTLKKDHTPNVIQRLELGRKTGAVGITNYTTPQGERYLLAAFDIGGKMTILRSFDNTLTSGFSEVLELEKDKDFQNINLVTDVNNQVYLLGFITENDTRDEVYLYQVDFSSTADKPLRNLDEHHMTTEYGGIIGPPGVHFRWGASLEIRSPDRFDIYATQRNFVAGKAYYNSFKRT